MLTRRAIALLAAGVLAASVLGACSSDDSRDGAGTGIGMGMDMGGMHHDEENSPVPPDARTIEVSATNFAFTPDRIEARRGEPIEIELSAGGSLHDFTIDELDVHVAAGTGETERGGFTAPDEAGQYTYYCSVAGHRRLGMEGTLVVA